MTDMDTVETQPQSKTSRYADLAKATLDRKTVAKEEAELTDKAYRAQLKLARENLQLENGIEVLAEVFHLEILISESGESTTEAGLQSHQLEARNPQRQSDIRETTAQLKDPLMSELLQMQMDLKEKQRDLLKRIHTFDQTINTIRGTLGLPITPDPPRPILFTDMGVPTTSSALS